MTTTTTTSSRASEAELLVSAHVLAMKARGFARWLRAGDCGDIRPDPSDYSEFADMLMALTTALSAVPPQGQGVPKLTDALILAAAEAHYGKKRVAASGGPRGISMTVDGRDYTFTQMMRRIWPAIRLPCLTDTPKPGVSAEDLAVLVQMISHGSPGWNETQALQRIHDALSGLSTPPAAAPAGKEGC